MDLMESLRDTFEVPLLTMMLLSEKDLASSDRWCWLISRVSTLAGEACPPFVGVADEVLPLLA